MGSDPRLTLSFDGYLKSTREVRGRTVAAVTQVPTGLQERKPEQPLTQAVPPATRSLIIKTLERKYRPPSSILPHRHVLLCKSVEKDRSRYFPSHGNRTRSTILVDNFPRSWCEVHLWMEYHSMRSLR